MWGALRKFGLAHCEFPTLVWCVATMLRVVALRIDRTAKPISIFSYVLTAVCAICYIYNYQVSMVWFVLVRCRETGDMLAATQVFSLGVMSLIGITKLIYMFVYRQKVQSIVAGYIEYDKLPVAPATGALLATRLRIVKKRALIFGVWMMFNGFMYILLPLFKSGHHIMFDEQVLYGLEPMLETPNYQISMVNIIVCVIFISFIVSNVSALLIVTTGYSEGRLLALSQELKLLWHDALRHFRENFQLEYREHDERAAAEVNRYIEHRLRAIIKSHATNVNLIMKVTHVFSNALATEIILLTMSLIGDLLGGLEHTYVIMVFALMQVSVDCYTGQKLIDASVAFEEAVYDCHWENFDASNMKSVHVMLLMSQKTLKVSAGGVATLDYECLMSLIKSIYSAYTALRSAMQ